MIFALALKILVENFCGEVIMLDRDCSMSDDRIYISSEYYNYTDGDTNIFIEAVYSGNKTAEEIFEEIILEKYRELYGSIAPKNE
jgi:hypothetical protein